MEFQICIYIPNSREMPNKVGTLVPFEGKDSFFKFPWVREESPRVESPGVESPEVWGKSSRLWVESSDIGISSADSLLIGSTSSKRFKPIPTF
jgi:hypothetical protein